MDRREKSKESKFSQGVSPFFLPDDLLMHKGKMDCILLGTGPRLALSPSFSVTIDGKVLNYNRASENKYLWNVLAPWLTWNAHVDHLVGNVRQRVALLGPIMKNINMYGQVPFIRLLFSLFLITATLCVATAEVLTLIG